MDPWRQCLAFSLDVFLLLPPKGGVWDVAFLGHSGYSPCPTWGRFSGKYMNDFLVATVDVFSDIQIPS